MDSEKQLRVHTSGSTMARHVWRVDKAPSHTRRNRNACLKVLWSSMGKFCACTCIYGLRCELVKCPWETATFLQLTGKLLILNLILTVHLMGHFYAYCFTKFRDAQLWVRSDCLSWTTPIYNYYYFNLLWVWSQILIFCLNTLTFSPFFVDEKKCSNSV